MAAGKTLITIRVDTEVLQGFKDAGPGYQTEMNRALKEWRDAQSIAGLVEKMVREKLEPQNTDARR